MNTDLSLNAQGQYEMRSTEALIVGTIALMSHYGQCGCDNRQALLPKIVGNMSCLMLQAELSAEFRFALGQIRSMWTDAIANNDCASSDERNAQLWHKTSEVVQ